MSEVIKHNSKLWERRGESKSYFLFWCPGCGCGHLFYVGPGFAHPSQWTFNGNLERPTFSPSLRHFYTKEGNGSKREITTCHLFVTDGQIQYCGDNPHDFNGKTVPMEDIPEGYGF